MDFIIAVLSLLTMLGIFLAGVRAFPYIKEVYTTLRDRYRPW